jgi:hypothetical protein
VLSYQIRKVGSVMMKWMTFGWVAAMLSLSGLLITGCEEDDGDGGGGNAFVGTWLVTKEGTPSYYVFNADGTFRKNLADEPVDGAVHFSGTYTVTSGSLHGKFRNPGVGTGEIEATINADDTMNLLFIEHWHTPYKRVPCTGVRQAAGTGADDTTLTSVEFLWKPISDNNGKLLIALPYTFANKVSGCSVTTTGGVTEEGTYIGNHNGGRPHYRYSMPGAQYGQNVTVVARLKAGGSKTWTVPDGAARTSLR